MDARTVAGCHVVLRMFLAPEESTFRSMGFGVEDIHQLLTGRGCHIPRGFRHDVPDPPSGGDGNWHAPDFFFDVNERAVSHVIL